MWNYVLRVLIPCKQSRTAVLPSSGQREKRSFFCVYVERVSQMMLFLDGSYQNWTTNWTNQGQFKAQWAVLCLSLNKMSELFSVSGQLPHSKKSKNFLWYFPQITRIWSLTLTQSATFNHACVKVCREKKSRAFLLTFPTRNQWKPQIKKNEQF